jgi:hypothetical protein
MQLQRWEKKEDIGKEGGGGKRIRGTRREAFKRLNSIRGKRIPPSNG